MFRDTSSKLPLQDDLIHVHGPTGDQPTRAPEDHTPWPQLSPPPQLWVYLSINLVLSQRNIKPNHPIQRVSPNRSFCRPAFEK